MSNPIFSHSWNNKGTENMYFKAPYGCFHVGLTLYGDLTFDVFSSSEYFRGLKKHPKGIKIWSTNLNLLL